MTRGPGLPEAPDSACTQSAPPTTTMTAAATRTTMASRHRWRVGAGLPAGADSRAGADSCGAGWLPRPRHLSSRRRRASQASSSTAAAA